MSAPPAFSNSAITRRGLFGIAGGSAALAVSPLAARGFGSGFTHGVASGEPGSRQVLLWTRYAAGQDVALEWQVSADQDFTHIAAAGSVSASPERDFCAKAWAKGLNPGRWYYYRFTAPDGSQSDVGRTRTLPESRVEKFRMAVFSCSNYGFGWFNAYAHAAEANDADLAVHLGDYIYEYDRGTYPSGDVAHPHRKLWPENEIVALADYRLRYATYRSDPDLRRIHQLLPMICIWDDHETANDSWKDGAQNHQSESEGDWHVRKEMARRAHREWMPISDEPYAAYEVGDLATFFRLDTRVEGREKQFSFGQIMAGKQSREEMVAALKSFREGDYLQPDRQLLGMNQEAWLAQALKSSRRNGKPWQVLVQQVVMGNLATPASLLDALGEDAPDYARRRIATGAMASSAGPLARRIARGGCEPTGTGGGFAQWLGI
jgi:alkaline phosphatase D